MNPLDLENIGCNVVLLLFQSLLRRGLLVAIISAPRLVKYWNATLVTILLAEWTVQHDVLRWPHST